MITDPKTHNAHKRLYLRDLDLGLTEGDLLPSSSIMHGLESFEEKCLWSLVCSSAVELRAWDPIIRPAARLEGPKVTPIAPSWCRRSWDEHWDWNFDTFSQIIFFWCLKSAKKYFTETFELPGVVPYPEEGRLATDQRRPSPFLTFEKASWKK